MHTTRENPPKISKAEEAQAAFVQMMVEASHRGFHGTAALTLTLQDGCIQNIRVAMERMIK